MAETHKDLLSVMIYGESGIVNAFPPHQTPKVTATPNVVVRFHTGAIAEGFNATKPDQLRGPQFDAAWCDELAKWLYAQDAWDMLQFGLRLGSHPRALITTTPRPIPVLREILADPGTVVTTGSTYDNAANLAPAFLRRIRAKYEGTRLGRQELHAAMLDDLPGALWTMENLEEHRLKKAPEFSRVVVAVDPSGTSGSEDEGDSVGIVVAGLEPGPLLESKACIIADRSCKLGPDGWGKEVAKAYKDFGADRVVAETNYGGAMVEKVIRTADPNIPYRAVNATRGKVVRAEPVAALYEQGRVRHVGQFAELEDQLCMIGPQGYIGRGSPDRADAAVWAITDLMLGTVKQGGVILKGHNR